MASFQPFDTNSIPDNKQAQIFLTNQSNSVYKMLSNLAAQQQSVKSIHELTMNDIQTFMAEQFDPKRFVVRERFKFWSDMKHVIFNPFKDPLDEALRTKFICSVDNDLFHPSIKLLDLGLMTTELSLKLIAEPVTHFAAKRRGKRWVNPLYNL